MKRTLSFALLLIAFNISCLKDKQSEDPADKIPKLICSADTVVLINNNYTSIYLSPQPMIEYSYRITSYPEWLIVQDYNGGYYSQGKAEIRMCSNLKPEMNEPGIYEGTLEIYSTLGSKSIFIRALVGEYTENGLPDSLRFSVAQNTAQLNISNNGNTVLDYTLSPSNEYITLSKTSGSIKPFKSEVITVTSHRQGMATGTYSSKISATIKNKVHEVHVTINHFIEHKIMLPTNVVDAEYNKTKDFLAYVSSEPMALNIYNCTSGVTNCIMLDFTPTCLSLAPDGNTAVAGHDAHVSYIDLQTNTVIRTYNVSCLANDIVIAPNQWAYVFPKSDYNARCVNLSLPYDNETESQSYSIYKGTIAKLHPSGTHIYGADNGLSPSDIEKYNIQNGTLQVMYNSPYHGTYEMGGNLWFSEDGMRIFTRGKTVLKTSEVQNEDMLYNGTISLEGYSRIIWLDHSNAKNNLYIISSGDGWSEINKPFVFVYNALNLNFKTKIELEKFVVSGSTGSTNYYLPEPHFVFSSSSGDKIYILMKATGAGLVNEWAMQVLKIG